MSAVWMRARAELRARWRASLALAGVIGLAGGLVLGASAGARRQDSTFPLFRTAQNTAQLGIANSGRVFGFANVNFEYARRLPEVVDTAPFQAFLGFIKTSRGMSLTPIGDENPVVSFASPDGRFDTVLNRMLIIEGHYADPAAVDGGAGHSQGQADSDRRSAGAGSGGDGGGRAAHALRGRFDARAAEPRETKSAA